jgi:hypothetical protein
MWVREHGVSTPRAFRELLLQVDPDQVIRLDNEPLRTKIVLEVRMAGG